MKISIAPWNMTITWTSAALVAPPNRKRRPDHFVV
jgi:hypothetical protein